MATQNMIERAYSTTPTATTISSWDANKNLSANNHLNGYATTVTAAATTTLDVTSAWQQFFTGTTTQTIVLPVASTLVLGQSFYIVNNSTGVVTVQSSGANTVQAMAASTTLLITCIKVSGTDATSWSVEYVGAVSGGTVNSGTANQMAYYAGTGSVVSGLTGANSARLGTSSAGVPSMMVANYTLSSSCAAFSTSSGSLVDVTNLSVSITTTGRPVMLVIQPDGNTSNASYILASASASCTVVFFRDVTQLGLGIPANTPSGLTPGMTQWDFPAAGTYTYKVQASSNGGTMNVAYMKLLAMEL